MNISDKKAGIINILLLPCKQNVQATASVGGSGKTGMLAKPTSNTTKA